MKIALAVFALSLAGIALLFVVKFVEVRRGRVFLHTLRSRLDLLAAALKVRLESIHVLAEDLLPLFAHLLRYLVRAGALTAAAAARYIERELHRLADMVSHKRGFERRETHNEFLKQASEHPMRDSRSSGGSEEKNGESGTTTV